MYIRNDLTLSASNALILNIFDKGKTRFFVSLRFIDMRYLFRNIIFCAAMLACVHANAQHVSIYVRDFESDGYVFSKQKKCDSISAVLFLDGYIDKMQKKSYYAAGYDSINYGDKEISAYATLGKPCANVYVDADSLPFRISRKKMHNMMYLPELCNQIVEYYTDRGYLFASAKLDSVSFCDTAFSAKISIDKGELIKLDSLIIHGDAKIKRYYLEHVLELKKNTVLTTSKIDRMDSRLRNIPFLEQEQPFQLAFSDTKSDVLLFLKNKKASSFNGVLGIMPKSQTTGRLMITGDIDLALVNVFHCGEDFKFSWKKYETQNQMLNIAGNFPYIFKSPIGLGADFSLEKKDSSYLKTDVLGKIIVGNYVSKGGFIYYRNTSSFPIGNDTASHGDYSKYKTNLWGFGIKVCNLDNVRNPYRGIVFEFQADAGRKHGEEEKPVFHSNIFYDISGYIGFAKMFTVKLRNSSKMIYSKTIFGNELLWIGGLNTVRGFDELSLPATYYTLGNIEFRYLFERNSAVYVLADAIYFGKKFTSSDASNYAMGLGVGVDLSTSAGIFSLIYAIGKQNDKNFNFSNSKIHFGYKSYF